jgi:dTDP-4-dehydrorhamnose 3,5-epimerase
MKFQPAKIPDIIIIEPQIHGDDRGFFLEFYEEQKFAAAGIQADFVQDNHSGSIQNTLRGLHYQLKHTQAKLVRAISGEVFDVAVDLRRSSPTFGKWVGVYLSAENKRQVWIPKGFAHGFYAISEWVEITYKVSDYYAPEWDRTLLWNDPQIGIEWPLLENIKPILSAKDQRGKLLDEVDLFE